MEILNKLFLGIMILLTLYAGGRYALFPTWLSQIVLVLCILISAYQYYTLKPLSLRGRIAKLRQEGLYPPIEQATDDDVKNLLRAGQKSAAIELYREIHQTTRDLAKTSVGDLEKTVRLSSEIGRRMGQQTILAGVALGLLQFRPELLSAARQRELALAMLIALIFVGFTYIRVSNKYDTGRIIDNLTSHGLYPREGEGTDEDVARLALYGHKMPAIILHHEIHRGSLQESANVVKRIIRDASRN